MTTQIERESRRIEDEIKNNFLSSPVVVGKCRLCIASKSLHTLVICDHQLCLDCLTKNYQYLKQNTLPCPKCGTQCVSIDRMQLCDMFFM